MWLSMFAFNFFNKLWQNFSIYWIHANRKGEREREREKHTQLCMENTFNKIEEIKFFKAAFIHFANWF